MTTAITTQTTFQDKIRQRIFDSIGDLMTDEELKGLIDKAMQAAFFQEREVKDIYNRTTTHPPFLIELLQNLLKERVLDVIDDWLNNHQDDIKKAVDSTIQAGIGTAILRAVEIQFENRINQLGYDLRQSFTQR